MNKKNILLTLAVFSASLSIAQQLPLYSQYYSVPFLYNPSMVGYTDDVNAYLIHKSMWVDLPGAPVTSALTLDGPIKEKNIGLGMALYNDVTDFTQRMGFNTSYSYKLMINDENTFRFGLSLGVLDNKIDYSRIKVKNMDDPFLYDQIRHKITLDANAGVTYIWKDLQVGIAVPQLFANKLKYINDESNAYYQLTRHYIASAKYTFPINKEKGMSISPIVMVRCAKNSPVQYDINAIFNWDKIGWAGVTYRSNYAVGLNIGFRFKKTLCAGYAYDLAVGPVKSYTGGAHEIMLGYTFGKKTEEAPKVDNSAENLRKEIMVDSMLMVLKKKDENQQVQIDSLKDQVSKLKAKQDSIKQNINSKSVDAESWIQLKAKREEFNDEGGKSAEGGYYVVVGAFKSIANAQKQKDNFATKGYKDAKIMTNTKSGYLCVYVLFTKPDDPETAKKELKKARTIMPDAWILEVTD